MALADDGRQAEGVPLMEQAWNKLVLPPAAAVAGMLFQWGRLYEEQGQLGDARDRYQLAYEWTSDQRVEWKLTKGRLMRSQHGAYTLEEDPDGFGTLVTYELSVDLNIPLPSALRRKAEQIILETALAALKRRVERADEPTAR